MAMRMLAQRKRRSETWASFFARRWRHARSMLAALPCICKTVIQRHHQAVGHLFRHSAEANLLLYEGSTLQHMIQRIRWKIV